MRSVLAVFAGVAGFAGGIVVFVACSSSSSTPPPPPIAATQCTTEAGAFPGPNCDPYPSGQTCQSPVVTCDTAPCTASSPCLAMGADNSGQSIASLRMRKLNITAPSALAFEPPNHTAIQQIVIDKGVYLHGLCGEGTDHDGTFSWLIQFDTKNNQVKTGGAPPTADPFRNGYCFVDAPLQGLQVSPVTVNVTKQADGTYQTDKIPSLNVPIYSPKVSGSGYDTIILPLAGAQVKGITLSENNNCIGSFNPAGITSASNGTCADDLKSCARWNTAGSLGGYITLDQANKVLVTILNQTLCVILTNGVSQQMNDAGVAECITDSSGHVTAKGDYCSSTDAPGGCQDSFWLAATFAASATKIVDPYLPDCMGGGTMGDGGAPVDAGGQ